MSDQLITFAQAVDHAEKNHNYRICIEIDAAREMLDQIRGSNSESFTVIAGKYDNQDKSCKYCDHFDTLDLAIEAYDKVCGYPWAYIEYQGRVLELWDKGNHPLRDDE